MERLKNERDYARHGVPAGAAIETIETMEIMEVIYTKAPCV